MLSSEYDPHKFCREPPRLEIRPIMGLFPAADESARGSLVTVIYVELSAALWDRGIRCNYNFDHSYFILVVLFSWCFSCFHWSAELLLPAAASCQPSAPSDCLFFLIFPLRFFHFLIHRANETVALITYKTRSNKSI